MTAGINLAKAGIDVEIYDKAERPGSRFHGDLQGIENWSDKEDSLELIKKWNLDISKSLMPNKNNVIVVEGKEYKVGSDQRSIYYIVKRGRGEDTIDTEIFENVKKYPNIKLIFNYKAENCDDFDIIASGPVTNDKKTDGLVAGYTFQTDYKGPNVILLDDKVAPDGYAYFLVKNNSVVLASCLFKDFLNSSLYLEKFYKFIKENYSVNELSEKRLFGGIGNFFLQKKHKKIYIGEAGGFQDFALGFGMKYAMHSGYLASKSIIENIDFHELLTRELYPKMKASIVNRFGYKLLTGKSYGLLAKLFSSRNTRVGLGYIYNYKWWYSLLLPLAKYYYRDFIKDPIREE